MAIGASTGGAAAAEKRNSEPSSYMRCMMTASFRATATTARLCPRLADTRTPQAFSVDQVCERVSMALAAS